MSDRRKPSEEETKKLIEENRRRFERMTAGSATSQQSGQPSALRQHIASTNASRSTPSGPSASRSGSAGAKKFNFRVVEIKPKIPESSITGRRTPPPSDDSPVFQEFGEPEPRSAPLNPYEYDPYAVPTAPQIEPSVRPKVRTQPSSSSTSLTSYDPSPPRAPLSFSDVSEQLEPSVRPKVRPQPPRSPPMMTPLTDDSPAFRHFSQRQQTEASVRPKVRPSVPSVRKPPPSIDNTISDTNIVKMYRDPTSRRPDFSRNREPSQLFGNSRDRGIQLAHLSRKQTNLIALHRDYQKDRQREYLRERGYERHYNPVNKIERYIPARTNYGHSSTRVPLMPSRPHDRQNLSDPKFSQPQKSMGMKTVSSIGPLGRQGFGPLNRRAISLPDLSSIDSQPLQRYPTNQELFNERYRSLPPNRQKTYDEYRKEINWQKNPAALGRMVKPPTMMNISEQGQKRVRDTHAERSVFSRKPFQSQIEPQRIRATKRSIHFFRLRGGADPKSEEFDEKTTAVLKRKGYKIMESLNSGSYGQVYKAMNPSTEELFAVKIINLEKCQQIFKEKYLPQEMAALIKGSSHPNIISLFDIFKSNKKLFVFMEFASNGDLAHYLKNNGPPNEPKACVWFRQISDGLNYLHTEPHIAHRDIKVDNILLDDQFVAKLADFGFAKTSIDTKTDHVILSETYCGSEPYYCPQIVNREKYNPFAADCWAMGVVLFAMINNKFPFHFGEQYGPKGMLEEQMNPNFVSTRFVKEFSKHIKILIVKLLDPDETTRIPMVEVLRSKWIKEKGKCSCN